MIIRSSLTANSMWLALGSRLQLTSSSRSTRRRRAASPTSCTMRFSSLRCRKTETVTTNSDVTTDSDL